MNEPPITLPDCLAQIESALNSWYPTKADSTEQERDARARLFAFRDRLKAQLRFAPLPSVQPASSIPERAAVVKLVLLIRQLVVEVTPHYGTSRNYYLAELSKIEGGLGQKELPPAEPEQAQGAEPSPRPIPAIHSAAINIGTAANDCNTASAAWMDGNLDDARMWIGNAIAQLESARAKITACQAETPAP